MIAAGAAAGTAAIFNAPIAGIAFAIELLLISINSFAVFIIIIATVTAALINRLFLNSEPIFAIQSTYVLEYNFIFVGQFFIFALFGLIVGFFSIIFIRGVYWLEDILVNFVNNPYLRHMSGMFIIGLLIYFMIQNFGHYFLDGIGYATIKDCLNNLLKNPWLLLILFIGKLFATCLSLGSGASGGIFSPTLFMGATIGAFSGLLCNYFFPSLGLNPMVFTIVGMAAAVGSTTGAVITSMLLVFELTRNFESILPILISVTTAYFVRKHFCKESIYTVKLSRKGINVF